MCVLRIISLLREYREHRANAIDRKVNVMVYSLHIDRLVNVQKKSRAACQEGQTALAYMQEGFHYVTGNIYGEGHVRGRIA